MPKKINPNTLLSSHLHSEGAHALELAAEAPGMGKRWVTDIIAEEGVLEEEAEEIAIVGVIEVVKEFLDSVGHRYLLE